MNREKMHGRCKVPNISIEPFHLRDPLPKDDIATSYVRHIGVPYFCATTTTRPLPLKITVKSSGSRVRVVTSTL